MVVGFTGTRRGMTEVQRSAVREWLKKHRVEEAHHGCDRGADADFHELCGELGIPVVGHPPSDTKRVMRLTGFAELREPRPYLDRNEDIVESVEFLIATPRENYEELRSGTWATVRYATKQCCPRKIFWPGQ